MKPQNIFLIRHGQSEGNANKHTYFEKADHALHLTPDGQQQAAVCGSRLYNLLPADSAVAFWSSPFTRARETSQIIISQLGRCATQREQSPHQVIYKEDPRLREIDWGTTDDADTYAELEAKREAMWHKWAADTKFYFRMPSGESYAQVYDRLSSFLETLHRDFHDPLYPRNLVISGHGGQTKALLMRFFHWTIEEFDAFPTPKNCDIIHIEKLHPGCYQLRGVVPHPPAAPTSPSKPPQVNVRPSSASRIFRTN